ncbi:MAG: DUF3179 domain-containing protein [Spirochaetia bacterium]
MKNSRSAIVVFSVFAMATTVFASAGEEGSAPQPPTSPAPGDVPPPDAKALLENSGFRSVPGFQTDFSRSTIPSSDVMSGGPPKDGIPAVDHPIFVDRAAADEWLAADEPVFVVSVDGQTHIYPVQILTYHEIVNDVVGGTPVTVTFCPLCNSGLTFRREFGGDVLDFGTTGRLRLSNLIMYDRQTETWWQQATGEGLVGRYAGFRLDLYPMIMLPWDRARDRFTDAAVLSRDTGYNRPYGNNPYAGYDTSRQPFLYAGPRAPGPFTSMDRVLEVKHGQESAAFPYPVLAEERIVQREVGGESVVVFWEAGTSSALDARSIANGRDVGVANAFSAVVDGRTLTFEALTGSFRDIETGTIWDAFGVAIFGELEGKALDPVIGVQHFWFSYSAFSEDGRWRPVE